MTANNRLRVLAIAGCTGAIAWVFLIDGTVKARKLSRSYAAPPTKARSFIRTAIAQYCPDIVVLENPRGQTRKTGMTIENLKVIAQDLCDQGMKTILVEKRKVVDNKYVEAEALVKRYPELGIELRAKPKQWQNDPKGMLYFEAVVLAEQSGQLRCADDR